MTTITRTLQTLVQRGRLFITVRKKGLSDTVEAANITPFGFESNPIKDMVAIYSDTETLGDSVILGYVNKNLAAQLGESRMFSTDADGNLKMFVWCKNDGKLQLGGTAHHLATFEDLKSGFDTLKSDLNDMKSKWNAFCAAYVPGSPSVTGLPATLGSQTSPASTASIDSSKIDRITTP